MKTKDKGLWSHVQDFLEEPMPTGVGWMHVFGSILLFLIILQLVTGLLLALTYSPSTESAYESVQYIDNHVLFGKFIRGLHHWSSSAFVIVLIAHILRTFLYGAYKPPRRAIWITGVCLLLVVLAFAFTGYLLPWDMKAYFATRVGIEVGASAPILGPAVAKLLQGGSDLGELTLTRFYALHVIGLPLILLAIVGIHLFYVRVHKITPPWTRNTEAVQFQHAFFPTQFARDQIAVAVLFVVVAILALKMGALLESKADPTDSTYVPRPDWYFYGLYQLLRIFQGRFEIVGTVLLPSLFFLALLALPFIDKNQERVLGRRRLAVVCGLATFFIILVLTIWGGIEGAQEVISTKAKEAEARSVGAADVPTGDPKLGSELFQKLRCQSCHSKSSRGVNIPPGLELAGSRFQVKWLEEYLLNPYRIRWADTNIRPVDRMPDFRLTRDEARHIAAFLMQNVDRERIPETGIDWAAYDSTAAAEGKQLVNQYACSGCHVIGQEGTNLGPDLDRLDDKLQPDYIYHLIRTPKDVIPETPMKDNQLWEDEAEAIVRYLSTLR